jgi:8-oxo-dGTP pyrophosphatase MutT (NUDIX family)
MMKKNIYQDLLKLEVNFSQSAVIPYRLNKNGLEILLITSLKRKHWIVPKGYIEFNLTPFESAKKEAYEEAGVLGSNETLEVGTFALNKPIGICVIKVFTMEVYEVLDEYPERNDRKRKWFTPEEASEKIAIPEIGEMIKELNYKLKVA